MLLLPAPVRPPRSNPPRGGAASGTPRSTGWLGRYPKTTPCISMAVLLLECGWRGPSGAEASDGSASTWKMRSSPARAAWTVCHSLPRLIIGTAKRCKSRTKAVSVPSERSKDASRPWPATPTPGHQCHGQGQKHDHQGDVGGRVHRGTIVRRQPVVEGGAEAGDKGGLA